jgi:hypothetical protein
MAIKIQNTTVIDDGRQLNVVGVNTISNVKISSGIVTASAGIVTYYGDGQYLDNIVSGVGIQSSGVVIGTGFTTLNFIGAGNTFAVNGTTVDISIEGGGGITVQDEGITLSTTATTLNFVGDGVVASGTGATKTVSIAASVVGGGEVSISTNTSNQNQYIPYVTSFGSTTGFGATSNFVFNPSDTRLGIKTTAPQRTLQVNGDFLVSAGAAVTNHIFQRAYEDNNGSISWESTSGQLLSFTNNLTSGSIFNVTNTSGIPYVDVDADGRIDLSPYDSGDVNVGGGVSLGGITLYPATGIVSATSFYGDGSNLTIGTETLSGGLVTLNLNSAQDHKVTSTGITTITVSGGTEGDSHTVRIVNSGIATVGFSTYFLFPSGSPPTLPTASGAISLLSFTVHRVGTAGTQLLAGASVNFS